MFFWDFTKTVNQENLLHTLGVKEASVTLGQPVATFSFLMHLS